MWRKRNITIRGNRGGVGLFGVSTNRGLGKRTVRLTVDGLTYEGIQGETYDAPLIMVHDERSTPGNFAHFRNVKHSDRIGNSRRALAWVGRYERVDQKRPPKFTDARGLQVMPLYFHDYYGPGRHAKVVAPYAKDFVSDRRNYRSEDPLTARDGWHDFYTGSRVTEVKDIELADAQAAQLQEHLSHCDRCLETVQGLKAEDTLVNAMRGPVEEPVEVPADTGVIGPLVEQLCALHQQRTHSIPAVPAEEPIDFLAPPQAADELGRLGGYRVLSVLGVGGMGVVFRAEDLRLRRAVALKVMKPALAASAAARQRFLREAQAAAAVEHDHVIAIHQVDEDGGLPLLAMPLLRGETLAQRLEEQPILPAAEVLRIGREVALGLAEAHQRGLIHRDIKPGNIWLEAIDRSEPEASAPESRVKILDFGLAKPIEQGEGAGHITQSGVLVGTPLYMAPEQARGEAVDARSDLFSLGVVLYRMCTGKPPFQGATTGAVLMALASVEPEAPCKLNPEVPVGLSQLIEQLLAKDSATRPASAREVGQRLAALQSQLTAPPRAGSRTIDPAAVALLPKGEGARRKGHRRLVVAATLALLLIGGVVFSGTLLRIATNKGELVIEADDPNIEVTVKDGSTVIYDKVKDRRFVLTAGDYEVEVREEGDGGARFSTKKFTITRGGKETLNARVELAKAMPSLGDNDRKPAEWVLSLGGKVQVRIGDEEQLIEVAKDLPPASVQLVGVHLFGNPVVTDAGLKHLTGLAHVARLNLGYTQVSDAGLVHLKTLTNLIDLNLHHTRVTDVGLEPLKGLTNLIGLYLPNTQVTDAGLVHLKELTKLASLDLHSTQVSDAGLKSLRGLSKLRQLDLTDTQVTAAGIAALKKALPQCQINGPAALPASPLDALDPAQIPAAERFAWQPKELVAVLGEHRQRHWGGPPRLALQPSGKLAATVADDGIRIWETDGLKQVAHLSREKLGAPTPHMLAFSADGERLLFPRLKDDKVCELGVYDRKAQTITWQTLGPDIQPNPWSFLLSPDGEHMALPGTKGAQLWDIRGTKPVRRHVFPRADAGAFSPDGKRLAIHEYDEKRQQATVRVYDLTAASPELRVTLPGESRMVAFTPDGRLVSYDHDPKVVGLMTGDGTLRFWDVSGTQPRLLDVVKKAGWGCRFSPHGGWMFTMENSYQGVGCWKMETGKLPVRKTVLSCSHLDRFTGLAVAPDEKTVIVSAWLGGIESYSIDGDKIIARHKAPQVDLHGRPAFHLAQNGWLVLPDRPPPRLWKLGATSPRAEPPFPRAYGSVLGVSPSGKTLVFNRNGELVLARAPGLLIFNQMKQVFPDFAMFSAVLVNDTTLATAYSVGPDWPVIFYDVAADPPREIAREKVGSKDGYIRAIRRADDGRTVAWLENDWPAENGRVRAWVVAGAKAVRWADLAIAGAVQMAVTADGQTLLVGRQDGWLEFWERQGDRAVRKGHMLVAAKFDPEGGFAVSPDGRRLAFCDKAGRLAIWDIASAKVVWQHDLPGVVYHLAFAPDGRHLLTANSNGTLYVLRLAGPQPAAKVLKP